jgi:hypothetical protein
MTEIISLRDYIDSRLEDIKERMSENRKGDAESIKVALDATKFQLQETKEAINERLKLLNEFRGQSEDNADRYALRELVDAKIDAIGVRLNRIEQLLSNMQGRAIALAGFGALIGGTAVASLFKFLGI